MLATLYIHTVKIVRPTQTGTNSLGEETKEDVTVYENVPARVEQYSAKTQYRPSGQRGVDANVVYIPPTYTIDLQDQIWWNGVLFGKVIGINPAVLGTTSALDHLELDIERP